MMPTIVSSLIYIKGSRLMELFPLSSGNLWKDWEVRFLVLFSLTLQIILIIFGKQRKFTSRAWIRIVLWWAYLMADSIATVTLGVISKNLGDVNDGEDGSLDASLEMTAFWAPFLLLHLGGPDTITAYSLEDNELWLRHLLGLAVQTGVVIYIWIIAGIGSQLSILSILIFFSGIIKYGERTWVLWSASNGQLKESMLTAPDPGPNYSKFMREYTSKQFEGFEVTVNEKSKTKEMNLPLVKNNSFPDAAELVIAYDLLQIFKRLFVDLILDFDDREHSQTLFEGISSAQAFKIIEMELGFMYDVLYTKATVINLSYGWVLRMFSFSFTCITLLVFSVLVIDNHKYSTIDLVLTFLLLIVAILLEVCALLLLLSSDWTGLWLTKHAATCIGGAITFIQRLKQPRWSNSMAQFNLLSFSLKDKQTICYGIQKLLHINKMVEMYQYTTCETVTENLEELIFDYLNEKFGDLKVNKNEEDIVRKLCSRRGEILKDYGHPELDWSVKAEFDQSILIWHIATDLCLHSARRDQEADTRNAECSKWISQYMLYLLVICPSMLPMGIGMIRFRDTCAEVTQFLKDHESMADSVDCTSLSGEPASNKYQACEILPEVNTQVSPAEVKGDRSKSVLFDACRLASKLQAISDTEQKWKMITMTWVEMLAYAACHCRGNYHAKQLSQGGELLTHVWLLMAHFGLTEQCQISQGHARAKLVVE
ncbi:hypothetical protein ACJW30_05G012000 [Castanea mollissima]